MATNASIQRTYRAPCPGCGAPVEFRSAQSTHAVCTYCHTTVVRDGETLKRLGKMAELFDDHSPLQLQAQGQWEGRPFMLVGRIQYRSSSGAWTEWQALFDDGERAWLAEDNGAYVMAREIKTERELPPAEALRLGAATAVEGKRYTVAANDSVTLVSAEGELPKLPPMARSFPMVELRSADNTVLSFDYGGDKPVATLGRPVALEELKFTGLREDSVQESKGRQFACPNCGAQVEVQLADSKSVTCRSCHSLIDLRNGIGGELVHAEQDEPMRPTIPLGSAGQLQGVDWQVVGYQHRLGTEPDDPDEHFGWDEYLLYNRKRGFAFLVDSTEGWSLVRPVTGAPTVSQDFQTAKYLGSAYQLLYSYKAQTTYVAGEFYWPVQRGHTSFNRDYAKQNSLLSMEETPKERTWSAGNKVPSDQVAKAFGLEDKKDLLQRGDVGPVSGKGSGVGCGCATLFLIFFVLVLLVLLLKACDDEDWGSGSGYTSGGRSGSWSSGGSHK